MLNESGKLTEKNTNLLSNRDYCSGNFLCLFAILYEVPTMGEIPSDYYNDNSGRRRYHPERYMIGEKPIRNLEEKQR